MSGGDVKYFNIFFFVSWLGSSAVAASLSVLKGNTYKSYAEEVYAKEIITIDHYGTWQYGSVFFYYDISRGVQKNDQSDFFGGISPMFSLTKITGKNFANALWYDVDLKLEVEHVSNFTPVYYYGISLPLKVPRFKYFTVAPVLRDDPTKRGVGGQLNIAWGKSFVVGPLIDIYFTGFLSAGVIPEAQDKFFMVTQPQVLLDLGRAFQREKNQLYTGVEYSYAINRFLKAGTPDGQGGTEPGFDERVVQAMVKLSY